MIKMYDFQGNPKKSGGDVLLARLHNRALEAGVAGRVVDHLNGSYSAVFPLLWEGSAQVEVTLVHSSEAVTVLHRLNREHPERVLFKSLFRSGSISETASCNVCLRQTNQPQCNYTDLRTGEPWFCYKPKKLSCDDRINHMRAGFNVRLKDKEEKLFQSKINLKVFIHSSGPANVTVLPPRKGLLCKCSFRFIQIHQDVASACLVMLAISRFLAWPSIPSSPRALQSDCPAKPPARMRF
nr:NXPE family member 3-like [Labrus bergylta]